MSSLARSVHLFATIVTLGTIRLPAFKRQVRKLASACSRMALRLRAKPYVSEGEPVTLIISPHQDDDVLGCGGLIARKSLDGYPVHVVYLTDGSASHKEHPTLTPETVARLRETEARAALRKLGVETPAIHFLGAQDGTLSHLSPDQTAIIVRQLREVLDRVHPDEIFTPYRKDGSSEHEAAFGLLALALGDGPRRARLYEYPVWAWWNPVLLARPWFTSRHVVRCNFKGYGFLKQEALACHRSQFQPTSPWTKPVIAPDFTALFTGDEEFYFEI